jgi:hypothetical protein
MAQSLLFVNGASPFTEPAMCNPGRQEIPLTLRKNGRIYRFVIRDKVTIEDPYIVLIKARAFSIRTGEPFGATPPSRPMRDFLIKSSVVI